MGSKKKKNTAEEEEQDFIADVLADELQTVLKSVPEPDAEEFFNSLKDEMLEEGVLLETSAVQAVPEEEFTKIDLAPEAFEEEHAQEDFEESQVFKSFEPTQNDEVISEESTTRVAQVEEAREENIVEAQVEEVKAEPVVREYEDKTSAVQSFAKTADILNEDKTQDLSALEEVASVEPVQTHNSILVGSRNPAIDLKNADYIKFAQGKIKTLEKELSDLRMETQDLALAGSHFKALADEREQRNKSLEARISEVQNTSLEEKKILNAALEAKDTKVSLLQERVESLEVELESKYNRLRVRERELESRLEILKQEQDAVASSKDELILRVKKQNNALTADLERARSQSQKTSSQLQEKEDALRRTIKALKLSLTMLESQKQN